MATRKEFRLHDPEAAKLFEIAVSALKLGMEKSGPEGATFRQLSDVLVDLTYELEAERSVHHA